MKGLNSLVAGVFCIGLSSCEANGIRESKEAVRYQLPDPGSAEFRNVFISHKAEGVNAVCGEVNSANALGGKTGFKRFVAAMPVFAIVEKDKDKHFDDAWRRFCGSGGR